MSDAFDQLEAMATEQVVPEGTASGEPRKPATPPAAKSDDDPGGQPKPGDPPAKPEPAAQLRSSYQALKEKHAALEAKHAELEKRLSTPQEDPEKKRLEADLAARNKRLQELEEEQQFSNYEKSEDFKQRWDRPWQDAFQNGRNKAASLRVIDPETQEARQGTQEDFDKIMQILDDEQAADLAAAMFGNKASMVLFHRERSNELLGQRRNAVEDYRKNGVAREQARREAMTKENETVVKTFQEHIKAGVEKFPQWFKPPEGDPKGSEILEKGMSLADEAFGSPRKDASGKPIQRSRAEMAKLHAAIRNKAGSFDYVVYQNRQQAAKIKQLETKLSEYQGSEPSPGDANGRGEPAPSGDLMTSTLDSLSKLAV